MPSSVSFFKLPVQLTFKNATQEKTVTVDNTVNDQIFIRSLGFTADTVLVDPGLWLITKNNTTEKTADVTDGSCNPKPTNNGQGGLDIYPNPVTNPVTINLHDFNDQTATVNIYNKLGQIIYNKNIPLYYGTATITLPAGNWARGVYIVKVVAGGKSLAKQMVR